MAAATLIVDDDNSACEATIDLLRAMGFVAKGSQSAEDFLEPNHLGRTSCLIADMRMPGMSGLTFTPISYGRARTSRRS